MLKACLILMYSFFCVFIFSFTVLKKNRKIIKLFPLFFIFSFFAVSAASLFQVSLLQVISVENNFTVQVLFSSFIKTSLTEEFFKFCFFALCLKLSIKIFTKDLVIEKKHQKIFLTNKTMQSYILLSIFFGLNFAAFENISYIVQDLNLLMLRTFSSTIIHAALSIYYAEIILYIKYEKNFVKTFLFSAAPFLLHGFYNTFIALGGFFLFFAATLIVFSAFKLFKNLSLCQSKTPIQSR